LHEIAYGIQVLCSILESLLGSHYGHCICYRIVIGHVNLRHKATESDEVLSKGATKKNDANHRSHAAASVQKNMSSSFRVEYSDIVAHETIHDLKAPWNRDKTHEDLHFSYFKLQSVFE